MKTIYFFRSTSLLVLITSLFVDYSTSDAYNPPYPYPFDESEYLGACEALNSGICRHALFTDICRGYSNECGKESNRESSREREFQEFVETTREGQAERIEDLREFRRRELPREIEESRERMRESVEPPRPWWDPRRYH